MNNVRNSEKKLVVLSAPSGAGKSSLLNNVISQHHDIGLTISHTTRDIRPSEKNNIDYYFISKEKFQAMINEEEFIEFAEVHGNFYGTTKKEIDEKLMNFEIVILEIDTNGAKQVLSKIANCRSIFILPPSYSSLEKRLLARKTENKEQLEKRLRAAKTEIKEATGFDYVMINDVFEESVTNLTEILYDVDMRLINSNHVDLIKPFL
ncbi:MAG: guanylate kinase [Thiotrichaceae bacterium]|nr:MAG: guanylate kinase [Thiotrichaceae bacterium]